MERCTDNRSLTPPLHLKLLAAKSKENGKIIASSLYDNEDPVDIIRPTTMSNADGALYISSTPHATKPSGLCNYDSTSDDGEVSENNAKSTPDHQKNAITKSPVINTKSRKSEERDRKNRQHRRRSRDTFPRRKSKDRKQRRSSPSHRSKDYHSKRSRSRSKYRASQTKDEPKAVHKHRVMRQTKALPAINYCDNGKFASADKNSTPVAPRQKLRRTDAEKTMDVQKAHNNKEENGKCVSTEKTVTNKRSNSLDRKQTKATSKSTIGSVQHNKAITNEKPSKPDRKPDGKKNDITATETKSLPDKNREQAETSKKSPKRIASVESTQDVTVTSTDQTIKTPPSNAANSRILSEEKMKQYIDEYDSFIQQVASPLTDPLDQSDIAQNDPPAESSAQILPDSQSELNVPKNDVSSTCSERKRSESVSKYSESSQSSTSSSDNDSSSSSSDSSTSSSSSSSSSDSSSSSSSDESSDDDSIRRKKSTSSSSSRSASKSPRIQHFNSNNAKQLCPDSDSFDFSVGNPAYSNGIDANTAPLALNDKMYLASKTLESLDALMHMDDDDDDLFRSLDELKKNMHEKLAKQAAEKCKPNETRANEYSGESALKLENGIAVYDGDRKKVSLTLKTTTLMPPCELGKLDEQENRAEQQAEKRTSEEKMSSRKKSSHRKESRRLRRSEERKSRRSEERSRSRRSEDRRSREKTSKRNEDRRSRRSEERRSRHSEERRSRRSEEKRPRRSEERRNKRRRSPHSPGHYRDSYYSPPYRNRSLSPLPRGPRTPPNTPPPNSGEMDELRADEMAMRHLPYTSSVMPPPAQYQPGPNPYANPNLPPNAHYLNDYSAYMHPNRVPMPQYNRPPPGIMPVMPPNSEYYYHTAPPTQPMVPNAYSNLIEVSPYGPPNPSIVDCMRKQSENRRKPTIAVQKGNVLEIVPSAELQCDSSTDFDKSEKSQPAEKQQIRQKQDRNKRKLERHQKRAERAKHKEFLMTDLNRLSHLMMFDDNGKMIRAGEILKTIKFDGSSIKLDSKEDDEMEEIYIEPTVYTYDPNTVIKKGILSDRNAKKTVIKTESGQPKRRGVLFADGIIPGEGTSASDDSGDEMTKPKKLSSRAKNKKSHKNYTLPSYGGEAKENSFESKMKLVEEKEVVPPAPPGSPPPQLPQPRLKDPNKFIVNQLLYFHYDLRANKMIITPAPHMMPMMNPTIIPTIIPPPMQPIQQMLPIQPMQAIPTVPPNISVAQPMYKSASTRHHSDIKISKSIRSSSSKHYHSSHKHASNETNLIVLSSSPSNA